MELRWIELRQSVMILHRNWLACLTEYQKFI